MKEALFHFIYIHGYSALYGVLALGIIGLPIPDETIMIFIGSLTYTGHLSYALALIVSFAGSMTGMVLSYFIGRTIGKRMLLRYGKWLHITPKRLERVERWYQRFGLWTVSFGYFVPGLRHFSSYMAGISEAAFKRYLIFAAGGAVVWCATFVTLGRVLGKDWRKIAELVHIYLGKGVFIIVLFAILCGILVFTYRKKTA